MFDSYLAMSYKCNHNCICCPLSTFDRLHAPLDFEETVKQVIKMKKLAEQNNERLKITLSGGEPTIYPNFLKLLGILSELDVDITILSNASQCEDKNFVKKILSVLSENYDTSKLQYVTAVHSIDPKIHDYITGLEGSFNQTMNGLCNLSNEGIKLIIKNIMNKASYKTLPKTFFELDKIFPKSTEFQFCSMDYSGRCRKHIDELFLEFKDLQPYLEETLDMFDGNDRKATVFESPLCLVDPYYWKFFIVNENNLSSYIAPNSQVCYNEQKSIISECNSSYPECSKCDVAELCGGVWKSSYEIGKDKNDFLRPVKVLKKSF